MGCVHSERRPRHSRLPRHRAVPPRPRARSVPQPLRRAQNPGTHRPHPKNRQTPSQLTSSRSQLTTNAPCPIQTTSLLLSFGLDTSNLTPPFLARLLQSRHSDPLRVPFGARVRHDEVPCITSRKLLAALQFSRALTMSFAGRRSRLLTSVMAAPFTLKTGKSLRNKR